MKILFAVNVDGFFVSHRLSLGLACLDRGYEVVVCGARTRQASVIERAGMRFVPLDLARSGRNPVSEARTVAQFVRAYGREQPDLVHQITIKPVLYGSHAAKLLGIPGVVNAISGLGYAFIPRARDRLQHRLFRRGLWLAYRSALGARNTRTIFQNEDDRNTFVGQGVVDRARTRLIPGSGVDLDMFAPSPLPAGEFLAVLPARVLYDKGVGEFVTAATELRRRHAGARFALVGPIDPGNPAAVTREAVEGWVRQGVVEWWGEVPRARMPDVYAQAHVVVLPSYREGLPLALAEAGASGRACITTDVPGCRDVVVPGETGWLVPARDAASLTRALEEAISDRGELERRSRGAAEFSRARFDLKGVVERTMDIYAELLAR